MTVTTWGTRGFVADHSQQGFATLNTRKAELDLDADTLTFFGRCAQQLQRPILITAPHTTLSRFVTSWLQECGGAWTVYTEAGLREVQSGSLFPVAAALLNPAGEQSAAARPALPGRLVSIAVIVRHRADPGTVIGTVANALSEHLTGAPPMHLGLTEPLQQPWSTATATNLAQRNLHTSASTYWGGAGLWGQTRVVRHNPGLLERTTVEFVVDDIESARSLAVSALESMATSTPALLISNAVTIASRSDGRTAPGPQGEFQPLATALGSSCVGELDDNVRREVEAAGARTIGRPQLPALLLAYPADRLAAAQLQRDLFAGSQPTSTPKE